jgi:tetratricopeptide (TPR) repeat protein
MIRFFTYQFLFLAAVSYLLSVPASAQKKFDFNANCRHAYNEILSLKLDAGKAMLNAEKKRDPDNLIPYLLENYIDFFVLFFDEDPAMYHQRKGMADERLSLLELGPDDSPFKLYALSIVNLQWALIKIKFDARWSAGWQFRRSFLQIKENRSKFPSFQPNQMIYGGLQTAIGTIPDGYKWLSSLFGMKGSISKGMETLSAFLNNKDEMARLFYNEALFYYLYLKYYVENKPKDVFEYINIHKPDCVNNHLLAFMQANLSVNNRRSEISRLTIVNKNPSTEYYPLQIWNYELGCAKLYHLEPDANIYFERYVSGFKGKFYVKDALYKLSWCYYLKGDMQKAEFYRKQVIDKGAEISEADKAALREAKTGKYPPKILLQARLLNDGGYSQEAIRLLDGKTTNDFTTVEEKLQFSYWLARIYDELGRDEEAIKAYKSAIAIGEGRTEYFAARAALQIGYIYEERADKTEAIKWFKRCIAMKNHDYENSIEQKAKAGIARCSGN